MGKCNPILLKVSDYILVLLEVFTLNIASRDSTILPKEYNGLVR